MRYRSCRLSRSESCCGGPKRSWTAWFPSLIRSAWQVLCGCAAARWPPGGPGPSQPTARPPGLAGSSPFPHPPVRSGHTWPPPGPKPKAASADHHCRCMMPRHGTEVFVDSVSGSCQWRWPHLEVQAGSTVTTHRLALAAMPTSRSRNARVGMPATVRRKRLPRLPRPSVPRPVWRVSAKSRSYHDGPALTRSGEPDDGGNRRPQPAITGAGRQPVKVQGDRRRLAARACGAGNRLAQLGKPVATTAHRHPTGGQPPLNLTQLAAQLLQAALLLQPLRLTFIPPYPGAAMTLRLPHEDRQTCLEALDRPAQPYPGIQQVGVGPPPLVLRGARDRPSPAAGRDRGQVALAVGAPGGS